MRAPARSGMRAAAGRAGYDRVARAQRAGLHRHHRRERSRRERDLHGNCLRTAAVRNEYRSGRSRAHGGRCGRAVHAAPGRLRDRVLRTAVGLPLQRRNRNHERVRGAGDVDGGVRRHARQQFSGSVVHVDDHVVGDDVVDGLRVDANLRDLAFERLVRICQHGKVHGVAGLDVADIRLADVDVHFHLTKILRDREERRRLQRGGHGLTD